MEAHITPYHIRQTAITLFKEKGFDDVTMAAIARQAGIKEETLFTFFGNKYDIILSLYQSINADWQMLIADMPDKKLSDRFEKALLLKQGLLAPYADVLGSIMGLLLRNTKIGINSPRTSHIRTTGLQAMQLIIDGATDSKALKNKTENLPSLLYVIHWAVLFMQVQVDDQEKTAGLTRLVAKMLRQANNLSFLLQLFPFFNEVSSWAGNLLQETPAAKDKIDEDIIKIIFNSRKTIHAAADCLENKCAVCLALHKKKLSQFTQLQQPIHIILPAFPAKSPNHKKVLGTLPDLGEEIALQTLEDLCREIKSVYPPGAYITICSDGRIFSELVAVTDDDVTAYVSGIKDIIHRLGLAHVAIVNLEDLMQGKSFDELRQNVLATYAEPLDDLKEKLKTSQEFKSLFNGMHRFITEDRLALYPGQSATKTKEQSKEIALQVIQHSNAWTRFLAYAYPDAVRLSIHPYEPHSEKIGIRLTKATDNWLTPWHGVIVLQEDGYVLMKRNDAEAMGARLVYKNEQPYYYTTIPA